MARGQVVQSDAGPNEPTNQRTYWADEIAKAQKRYGVFQRTGNLVVNRYRLERDNEAEQDLYQDRYNILYSTTETTKPSLYAQTPKVQAEKRHKDRENDTVTLATMLLESAGQYALEEVDFDGVMKNCVQDYLLPGMGTAWVRYEPTIKTNKGADGEQDYETVDFEGLDVDYVHYKDFITGVGRVWKELPWVARRVYFDKKKATKRFGKDKANQLAYSYRPNDDGNGNRDFAGGGGQQAIIWEIWDKVNREVVWYTDDYPTDVLDKIADPLKLRDFWPCPEPMRAVWTTRTFIPKAFYGQYKAQAEELDNLTERVRYLTQALRAIGVYDGSQTQLAQLLQGKGNKMVAVENWALFAQQGGIQGSIQWVPIKEIAEVLTQLLQQREIVKNEVYEITGFSDIVRGVSKASETLGAQKIKSDWAGGRLRDMQKEVQRFCRDIIRIMSEIMSEHFSATSFALYGGFDPPEVTPEEQAAIGQYAQAMVQYKQAQQQHLTMPPQPGMPPQPAPQPPQAPPPTAHDQAIQTFQKVVQLIKDEKRRCASIGIETDSTIMPDESAEREDRMAFLGAAGAFLQQAGPMALQFPDMRGLLGAIMMFTIRTFRASRPLEKEFEDFTKKLEAAPAQPPAGEGGQKEDPQAKAAAQAQSDQIKAQTTLQAAQLVAQSAKYEVDTKAQLEREKMQNEHDYRMAELQLRDRELASKEAKLSIDKGVADSNAAVDQAQVHIDALSKAHEAALSVKDQEHSHAMDVAGVGQQQQQFDASRDDADRNFDLAKTESQNSDNGA